MLVFNGCHQIGVGIGESSRVSPANGFGGHGLRAGEEQRAGRNVYCGYIGVVDGFGKVSQSVSVSNIRGVPSRPTLHVRPVSATATPRAPAPRRRTPPRAARAAITAVSEPRAQKPASGEFSFRPPSKHSLGNEKSSSSSTSSSNNTHKVIN